MARLTREKRHLSFQKAWLTLGGFARRECKVVDISNGGAKLEVDSRNIPTGNLGLSLARDTHKFTPCRLVWRKGKVIGVEFVD